MKLTVIGGFLGSGKTTLVNRLLASATRRWGVLVNDFGAVNIDAALIAARGEGVVELANGCVCCSLGDDLGEGLRVLASRDPPPEHVLVEASGVSDPWRIAELALIEKGFELQPLVVLASAFALPGLLADRFVAQTVRRQIAVAELVVLTHTDLADPAAALAHIEALRPGVPVVSGCVAEADFSFEPQPRPRASRLRADDPAHPFISVTIPAEQPFDRVRLRAVLASLPPSVLRVKGVCSLDNDAAAHVLQFAAGRWSFQPFAGLAPRVLVVIGTPEMPDIEAIARAFAAAH